MLSRIYPTQWEPKFETIRISKKKTKNYEITLNELEKLANTFT